MSCNDAGNNADPAPASETAGSDAVNPETHYPGGKLRVPKSQLTLPIARGSNTKWWGNPMYLYSDWQTREAQPGGKGGHCTNCGNDLT